jgi:DEAD/DEAH box helicase domain-containing protein
MPAPPWSQPHGVGAVTQAWLASGVIRPCLVAERELGAAAARNAAPPPALAPELCAALRERGIAELYEHQARAIGAALEGRHVVVATPTASGKSLCFHLPVLQALARDPAATALYLYPTKALSRDQEHDLRKLVGQARLGAAATVYDGDTPPDARRAARDRCRVVLTNPDMLHAGILPMHARWASLFQGLRYVIIDELHTYRGVFGSHMAHVIARLRRIAAFHGAHPAFLMATATIGNPREHAARLLGEAADELVLIDDSGAPRAARQVFIYNPPVVNAELGIRGSTLKHAVRLAADLVRARVPSIVFGPSRNSVEVMLKYLRAKVGDVAGSDALMAYRGGYLPETRRRIERGLRDGDILCVVATNALELGIDIGDLDAVVCAGYPGSVAGTWQRFGRAGRRGDRSIAVLVCSSAATDQYLAREPGYVLGASAEHARIDPLNVEILIQHLKCAAFEAPFELSSAEAPPAGAESYGGLNADETREALDYLAARGLLHRAANRYDWCGEAFPASSVSLRSIGWDNFVIIDVASGESLGELDWRAAHTMLHEQAIYQQDAEQYQVEKLDFENHKAFVRKVEPDYFTTALTYRSVAVLDESARAALGRASIGWGEVKVIEKVTGYKKIKFFTHENAGYGDVHLPEIQMHTTSFWLTSPEALIADAAQARRVGRAAVLDGLRGLGHALEAVASLGLMCDPRDLGQTLAEAPAALSADGGDEAGQVAPGRDPLASRTGGFEPTLFLFDAIPGGVGLAERIYERAGELLDRARSLVEGCSCVSGCPACVGPTEQHALRKRLTLDVLNALELRFATPVPALAAP